MNITIFMIINNLIMILTGLIIGKISESISKFTIDNLDSTEYKHERTKLKTKEINFNNNYPNLDYEQISKKAVEMLKYGDFEPYIVNPEKSK